MYEDLSAPTAATANVFAMAALAARENRVLATVNIGGAYLNASMVESGVIVQHMRLDKVMTKILVKSTRSSRISLQRMDCPCTGA